MTEKKLFMQENDKILDEWLKAFEQKGGVERNFSLDGIMFQGNIEKKYPDSKLYWRNRSDDQYSKENKAWDSCPIRFLYLTKDQNGGKEDENGGTWDAREETYCDPKSEGEDYRVWKQYKFNKMIAYTFRGLVYATEGKFMPLEDVIADQKSCINIFESYPLARINCKKERGYSSCPNDILHDHMKKYKNYLSRQINNLDADVFICCEHHDNDKPLFGTKSYGNIFIEFLNDNGYNFEWKNSDIWENGIWIDNIRKKIAIDTYHLSYRMYADQLLYDDIVKCFYSFIKENPNFFEK